jgi:hypothetical protein
MLLICQNVDPGVADDVPDVPDEDGEDEDTHQPGVNVNNVFTATQQKNYNLFHGFRFML